MRYTVVDAAEYTYPDIFEYATGAQTADVFTARGGWASFQIVIDGLPEDGEIKVASEGFEAELYSLYPVTVEKNWGLNENNSRPHMPERIAPYQLYDALMPYRGRLKVTDGRGGLYVAAKIDDDAKAGIIEGAIIIGELRVPVKITVYPVTIPEETLKIIQGYRMVFEQYHGVKRGSDEFNRLDREYMAQLRRMRQNMNYIGGVSVKNLGDNEYSFDFTPLENRVKFELSCGMKYFNMSSVGGRKSWKESTILVGGGLPAMSYEGYRYLSQYLPALRNFLAERGWLDRFTIGIADEPNSENATEFRALCGLVRRLAPEIKLIDAMSYGNLHGALDIWVPLDAEYDRHMKEMETLRADGDIWHYVCCGPRGDGYINRFMDYALLSTRYLFWGNYRHNLGGYLHWAINCYQNGVSADGTEYHQDPFVCNCPEHHNADSVCFLPAGDTHLLYPGGFNGNGERQEPWMSIRSENQRMSAEDYELLKLLSQKDKAKADEICASVFRSFKDVEFDVSRFNAARKALLEELAK